METLNAPFAIGTFSTPDGETFPGLVAGDRVLDLGGRVSDTLDLLNRWADELPRLRDLAPEPGQPSRPLADLRVHAPVRPRQIFQSGANYRQHVIDLEVAHRSPDDARTIEQARAEAAEMMDRRAREDRPYVFIGLPGSITGPYDDVVLPSWASKPDWELELAAVIGRPAYRISPDEALEYVAGYTIANDLTSRDALARWDAGTLGIDWLAGKNAPTFLPVGPLLVPAEFVGDPQDLQIKLTVNGRTMQDESTEDMLFDVARLISYLTTVTELRPGDLVLTGSPAGNGASHGIFLRPGDLMEGSVTGLGAQRNVCVAETMAPGATRAIRDAVPTGQAEARS